VRDRFQRASKRRGVRLGERDFAIVEAIYEARYMTNRQIANLLFAPTTYSWCKKRIRALFDLGYLRKRPAYVNEPDIYYLGLRGRRYIMRHHDLPMEYVAKVSGVSGGRAKYPTLFMDHDLALSGLYVRARQDCVAHGYEYTWRNTRMLELEDLGVQPDAWVRIARGGGSKAAYIEFTAQMPSAAEMNGKLAGYEALFEKAGPTQVLWFTTSRNKQGRLRDRIMGNQYRGFFSLGLIEDARQFLTRPIWWWSESEELVCFVTPDAQ
jgi:DNA-binding Lrp family transcriptional regulator